jgi:hypothetical protein
MAPLMTLPDHGHWECAVLLTRLSVLIGSIIARGPVWALFEPGRPGALVALSLTVTIIVVCCKVAMLRPITVLLNRG